MAKYIFVTGGVVSGLGKGITAASLGRLLKARGLKVAAQKLDPLTAQLLFIDTDPVINVRLCGLGQRPHTSHGIYRKYERFRMPADNNIGAAQIPAPDPLGLP